MTVSAIALSPPRQRVRIVCSHCGAPRQTHGIHFCPVVRCDPVNDDRREYVPPSPEQILGTE